MNTDYTIEWLKSKLGEERYQHSLGAEQAARELARRFAPDKEEKIALAALIHDNAKDIPYDEALQLVRDNNFDIPDNIKTNRKIIHAYLGACLAEKELNISDEEVLTAVRFHTTGRIGMTMVEKIVFLADKIESNTREPELREQVSGILESTGSIDEAIRFCVERTIRSLLDRKLVINKQTIDVWNSLVT